MSKIEKMSILGVRSFGPRSAEVIAFNTPLTLIVGYNGSGKTTIIECLKYATTGELPPNSKGGAFVHDPHLVGEKDVQAQIKLSFRSTTGESFVVTRNMQLVIKAASRKFSALEGSLLLRSNGERQVVSTRVLDLDRLVPEKLGVSSAILDSVIFCHQDESLWPMSAPADLKKRFDEIFEAQKYAKVIDNLKLLRKTKGEDLRILKMQEAQDKENKERADKVDKELQKLIREIQKARDEIQALTDQIDEKDSEIKEKWQQANSFLRIVNELQTKREKLEYKKDAIAELRERIEESTESDEYLRDALDQYQQTVDRMDRDRDQKVTQFGTLQSELKTTRANHTAKVEEQGRHQSDKDKYDRQLVSQRQMIKEAAEKHEIRGYDGELGDREINAFYERIQKMLQDTKRDLERLQRDNAAELDAKSAIITELESRKASRIRDRKTSSQRVATIQRDIAKLQGELNNVDVDEGAEAVLRTEMEGLESRIKAAKADTKVAELESQITDLNNEVVTLEAQSAKLNRELVECTNLATERAELEVRKTQLKKHKGELEALKKTFNQQLTDLIGKNWTPETIEADFQKALRRLSDRLSELRKTKDSTQQELKQVEYKLTTAREKQTKSVKERDNFKKDVVAALKKVERPDDWSDNREVTVDDYPRVVEWTENVLKDADTDLELAGGWTKYFNRAKKRAEKNHICELCERSVENDKAAYQKLLDNINDRLSLQNKDKLLETQTKYSRYLGTLRGVRVKYETYVQLCKDLPSMGEEINTLASQKEKLVRKLEDQDSDFKAAEEKLNAADALNKNVLKIAQHVKEIADSERYIAISEENASVQVRSAEEINEDQTACAEQLRVAQAKLAKFTTERQRLKDLAGRLEVERLELKHRITEAVQKLEQKKRLQDMIKNHKDEQTELRKSMGNIDKEVESIEPEIASARAAHDDSRKQGRAREQRIAEERDGIANTLSELKMIDREIQDYLDRGGPANLASNQRAIATLESTIATLERDMKDLTVQINKLNKDIDNSDAKRRNIADNLTYRKNLRERDALEKEIEELESRRAQEDYDRLVYEARHLETVRGTLNANRDKLMGSMSTKDEQFAKLNDEYEIELKGARARYKESHVKVAATKAAIDDLARGSMALDNAIIRYHSLKMEELNRTIGELWQSTYQGTDIDTIQIRSDMETKTTATNTRRNYNYRVSMIKGDTEMGMRGRCSAGQKVLACIIIRLALAESFGSNCGLIALDEPTTNLDSDNIRSLASSIHAIIKARRGQNNLQLVVITHDEEFLKQMQCSDFCDDFFRVRRDENQKSVISRESITRISE